jgi:hypothetical protein
MAEANASIDARRQALEELRNADRLVGGVLGTLRYVQKQQRFDLAGINTADGFYGEATQSDVASAERDLTEAQAAFRKALELLGGRSDGRWVGLERWGYAEGVLDGVFDIFAALKARRNLEAAEQVHAKIRELFASVSASDPALADVEPLADWSEEGFIEGLKTLWAFDKPAVIIRVGAVVLVVFVLVTGLIGMAIK